jgi:hypothetical protein
MWTIFMDLLTSGLPEVFHRTCSIRWRSFRNWSGGFDIFLTCAMPERPYPGR